MKKGILITLEGNEGAGKSTQIRLLYDFLKAKKKKVFVTREPGGTVIGDAIRQVLLDNKNKAMTATTETLLYMASRAQLVNEVILPRLKKGEIVLCDRWSDATVAYQGFGGGVDAQWIHSLALRATQGATPALSLFLDLPLEIGLKRAKKRQKADRMEAKNLLFHQKVRRGYLWIAKKEPKRFKKIAIQDSDSVETVHAKIVREVLRVLG